MAARREGKAGDVKPKAKKPPALHYWQILLWLEGQESYRAAADADLADEGKPRYYTHDLLVIRRLRRMVEIIEALGPQFVMLVDKNRALLEGLAAREAIVAQMKPEPKEEEDDDGSKIEAVGSDEAD